MLCSAVFVSLVHQKKYLCVQGFAESYARKGKGISLFDIFFSHILHWLRDALEK